MTGDPLIARLVLWRRRASTETSVDRAMRAGRPHGPFVDAAPYHFQGDAVRASPLPEVGTVAAHPCPSCGGPLLVTARMPPDEIHTECQNHDCQHTERK